MSKKGSGTQESRLTTLPAPCVGGGGDATRNPQRGTIPQHPQKAAQAGEHPTQTIRTLPQPLGKLLNLCELWHLHLSCGTNRLY